MRCNRNRQIGRPSVRQIFSSHVTGAFFVRLLLIVAIPVLLGGLLQSCGGGGGGAPVTNLSSITIDPVNSSIGVGTKVQLHATGVYKNKTTKDLTDTVTWESADNGVVVVGNAAAIKGLAAGSGVGATNVHAKLHGVKGVSAFTVTNASLKSITVLPVNPVVAKGTTVQLDAVGNFSDGSVQNLTTLANWSSTNSSIAQVSNTAGTNGLVTGVSVGNTPITATFNGIQGSTTVTVSAATLTSITITVPVDTIAKGTTAQLTATCNLSDGTTLDCTSLVSWTSANSGIASVSDTSPTKGLVTGVAVGSTTISGSFGGLTGSATVTVSAATLTSITITPPDPSIAKGTTVQLTATGNFSDGSTQDLTTQASWISGADTIAQVSNVPGTQGVVTGLATGNTSISATVNGIEGSTTVTVTAATLTSITVTPPHPSIAKGTTVQLTATGNFSDGTTQDLTTQVGWTSGNNAIAPVINKVVGSQGLVIGLGVGSTSITAALNGIAGSTTVTVTAATLTSITVTVPVATIAKGTTVQLTATCNLSDGTTQDCTNEVGWTSSDNATATVSNASGSQGLVTGLNVGSASITATLNGIRGSATVTVTAATLSSITVTPPDSSIAKGTTVQLKAIGNFSDGSTQDLTGQVSWTSSNSGIAEVINFPGIKGLVIGTSIGSATITAEKGGVSGMASVTVTDPVLTFIAITPPNPSIAKGTTKQLTAICIYSDFSAQNCTNQVSWGSSNINAIVSNKMKGLVYGVAVGSSVVNARLSGITGSTTVTVTPAILTSITITVPVQTIAKGTTANLTATCNFSDGNTQDCTTQVGWTSADNTIAQVSNATGSQGLTHGIAVGTTTIMATLNGIQGTASVTVSQPILIAITVAPVDPNLPPNPSIAKGTTVQLIATGTYSDGTTQDLTNSADWTSAPTGFVTVIDGLVTGTAVGGPVTVTAMQGTISGSTTVTVTNATLVSIAITPASPSIPNGKTQQLTAIGTYSDGSVQNLTTQVTWTVDSPSLGTINGNGLLTATNVGTGVIRARLGTIVGTTSLTVTSAVLNSIAVAPASSSIAKGTTVQLTATCTYSDGTHPDCTAQVNWTSGDTTVAQVSNVSGEQGLVRGLAMGSTSITATLNGIQNSATVTVTAPTLLAIIVTPANQTVPSKTNNIHYTATAHFSDGSTQDVTADADWTSSDSSVAQVKSNQGQSNGEVSAKKPGTATIKATVPTLGNASGSTTITVI